MTFATHRTKRGMPRTGPNGGMPFRGVRPHGARRHPWRQLSLDLAAQDQLELVQGKAGVNTGLKAGVNASVKACLSPLGNGHPRGKAAAGASPRAAAPNLGRWSHPASNGHLGAHLSCHARGNFEAEQVCGCLRAVAPRRRLPPKHRGDVGSRAGLVGVGSGQVVSAVRGGRGGSRWARREPRLVCRRKRGRPAVAAARLLHRVGLDARAGGTPRAGRKLPCRGHGWLIRTGEQRQRRLGLVQVVEPVAIGQRCHRLVRAAGSRPALAHTTHPRPG
eukprot:scaffold780_cov99-Isochrysis_galbana.AAC.6